MKKVNALDAVMVISYWLNMTTVISSHVKDKNCIFTGYQIFVTGKILVFHGGLYNKSYFSALIRDGPSHVYTTPSLDYPFTYQRFAKLSLESI